MVVRPLVVAAAALLLVGCGPTPPATPESPSTPASVNPTAFPRPLPVTGNLTDGSNALRVVKALDDAAGHRPALKLDVTPDSATLTVLTGDRQALAYQWSNDALDLATTDFQYLKQGTFTPTDYPLASIGTMFKEAQRLGVKGDLVFQIQEYGQGSITQSISSRPETTTVFFRPDATPVPRIGVETARDVAAGLEAVTKGLPRITQFGFSKERGYWAFAPADEQIVTRIRKDQVPTFETRKSGTTEDMPFDASLIDPAAALQAITHARTSDDEQCQLTVEQTKRWPEPFMTVRCGVRTTHASLAGEDIDDELEER